MNSDQIYILNSKIDEFIKNKNKDIIEDIEIEELIDELYDGSVPLTRIKSKYEYNKNLKQLFYKKNTNSNSNIISEKNTNLDNNIILKKNTNSLDILKKSMRQLNDMEVIGKDTLSELVSQREKIKNQKEKMNVVNDNIKVSNSLLNKMKSWFR